MVRTNAAPELKLGVTKLLPPAAPPAIAVFAPSTCCYMQQGRRAYARKFVLCTEPQTIIPVVIVGDLFGQPSDDQHRIKGNEPWSGALFALGHKQVTVGQAELYNILPQK